MCVYVLVVHGGLGCVGDSTNKLNPRVVKLLSSTQVVPSSISSTKCCTVVMTDWLPRLAC